MANTRTAVYARLSVDRDATKVGIDTQIEDSLKLAAERGWTVVDRYVDRNLTAADKLVHRPEYERLVADFQNGRYDALICWDLDRLTRQPRQLEDWIDAAEDRGLRIVTANGEADLGTDGGRMFARIKAAVAKGETERASARQKRNKQHRRENGLWHGGSVPYGYRLDRENGVLVPEPSEVGVINEAIRRVLEDREPLHSIVTDWNSAKMPGGSEPKHGTRAGKHWRQSNLRSILMNESLLGKTKAGVPGWDPIIDQRTFDRLQALFNDPARKVTHSPGVNGGKYTMGGGLTVCGKCGKPLITSMKRETLGREQVTIGCLRRVHGPDPEHHPQVLRVRGGVETWQDTGRVAIDHTLLEEHVFTTLIGMLESSPRWHQRLAEKDPKAANRLDAIDALRSDLRDQRERAGRAYVAGIMSERDSLAEVQRIDAELEALERESNSLLRQPILEGAMTSETLKQWPDWTPGRRRAFLRLFIARVEVGEWPEGTARTRFRPKDMTVEQFRASEHERLLGIVAQRVRIVWQWDA